MGQEQESRCLWVPRVRQRSRVNNKRGFASFAVTLPITSAQRVVRQELTLAQRLHELRQLKKGAASTNLEMAAVTPVSMVVKALVT